MGRTCTPTPSCPVAPPCTPVLPIVCKRRSPLLPHPPLRSRSLLPREEILRLDRRFHLVFPFHLPTDVDHQARVRRVRPIHCPQEVLLISLLIYCCNCWHFNCLIDLFLHCHLIVIDSMFTCLLFSMKS